MCNRKIIHCFYKNVNNLFIPFFDTQYPATPKSLHPVASMIVLNKDENAGRLPPVKFEDAVKRN